MGAETRIEADRVSTATTDYGMYLRERDYSRTLERLLARAVALLDMETHRRGLAGEDVAHLAAFVAEARRA